MKIGSGIHSPQGIKPKNYSEPLVDQILNLFSTLNYDQILAKLMTLALAWLCSRRFFLVTITKSLLIVGIVGSKICKVSGLDLEITLL